MTDIPHFPLSAVVGADDLKLALCLTAIDPRIGGVLIEGPRGMAKSTLARGVADLLLHGLPVFRLRGELVTGHAAPLFQRDILPGQQDVGRTKAGCSFHNTFLTLT